MSYDSQQLVEHITLNGRYRVVFEKSATKGDPGFKVEANGDVLEEVMADAKKLAQEAQEWSAPPSMNPVIPVTK